MGGGGGVSQILKLWHEEPFKDYKDPLYTCILKVNIILLLRKKRIYFHFNLKYESLSILLARIHKGGLFEIQHAAHLPPPWFGSVLMCRSWTVWSVVDCWGSACPRPHHPCCSAPPLDPMTPGRGGHIAHPHPPLSAGILPPKWWKMKQKKLLVINRLNLIIFQVKRTLHIFVNI